MLRGIGQWTGTNKLWFQDPEAPELSDGELVVKETELEYTWSFRGAPHQGRIEVAPGAVEWRDSWHAVDGMHLEGTVEDGAFSVVGTYAAGDQVWGWRITYDGAGTLRMYNVDPEGAEVPAVELVGRPVAG